MKRLWLAILIALFAANACLPCSAACLSVRMRAGRACCHDMSQKAEVTCCAPQQSSPTAIPQASQAAPVAAMLAATRGVIAASALLPAHESPLPATPEFTHAPPLVLRT